MSNESRTLLSKFLELSRLVQRSAQLRQEICISLAERRIPDLDKKEMALKRLEEDLMRQENEQAKIHEMLEKERFHLQEWEQGLAEQEGEIERRWRDLKSRENEIRQREELLLHGDKALHAGDVNKTELVRQLVSQNDGLRPAEIFDQFRERKVEVRRSYIYNVLSRLMEEGEVERRYGRYYSLAGKPGGSTRATKAESVH